jgi:hypothetical protein
LKEKLFNIFKKKKKLFNENNIFVPFLQEDVVISMIMYLLNFIYHIHYFQNNSNKNFKIYEKKLKKIMISNPNYIFNILWLSLNKNEKNQFINIRNFQFDYLIKKNNL